MNDIRAGTTKDSVSLYNVAGWSSGYFGINDAGHVEVTPSGPAGPRVDLHDLVLDVERAFDEFRQAAGAAGDEPGSPEPAASAVSA